MTWYRMPSGIVCKFMKLSLHMSRLQVEEGLASGIRGIEWDAVELPSQVGGNARCSIAVHLGCTHVGVSTASPCMTSQCWCRDMPCKRCAVHGELLL